MLLCCHPTIIVLRSALSCVGDFSISLLFLLFFFLYSSLFSSLLSFHLPSILLSLTFLYPKRCSSSLSLTPFSVLLSLHTLSLSALASSGLSVKSRHRHQPHRLLSSTDLTKNPTFLLHLCKAFFFAFFPSPSFGANKIRLNSFICNFFFFSASPKIRERRSLGGKKKNKITLPLRHTE